MFKLILQVLCAVLSVNLQCIKPTYTRNNITVYSTNNQNNVVDCDWDYNKVRYSLLNNQTGDIILKFRTHIPTGSNLIVYVQENVIHKECLVRNEGYLLHSEFIYHISQNDSGKFEKYNTCGDEKQILLSHVFTGCYILSIETQNNTFAMHAVYIETGYQKMLLTDPFIMIPYQTPHQLELIIEAKPGYESQHFQPGVILAETDTIPVSYLSNTTICNITDKYICSNKNTNQFVCLFYNLQPRNYSFIMYLPREHIRCNPKSLWTEESETPSEACIWLYNFSIEQNSLKPNHNSLWWLLIIAVAIIVVLILLAMFCLNKMLIYKGTGRLSKDLQVLLKSNNPIGKASQKKILILYARESDQFERVINSFNNMLKEDEAVEIYDLYELDAKCLDPPKWLHDKFADDNMKIILFLNLCASVFYSEKYAPTYKSPHCFDRLFPYSLQLLRSDTRKTYHNLYVIQITTISLPQFRLLNPFTRYTVPEHIRNVLMDMGINSPGETLTNNFKGACQAYVEECIKNTNYLENLLDFG